MRTTLLPLLSLTTISDGTALALSGLSLSVHLATAQPFGEDGLPSLPTSVVTFCPANSTVMLAPGVLQPQTGSSISRCKTMLSQNSDPSLIATGGLFVADPTTGESNQTAASAKTVVKDVAFMRYSVTSFIG